jgi:hypothetical protein
MQIRSRYHASFNTLRDIADERNHPANLLLLCGNHHKLVDTSVSDFSVDRLLEIKQAHEDWVKNSLEQMRRSSSSSQLSRT